MSYILDALKKAERDRRVRRVPTLGTIHGLAVPQTRRLWPWIAGGAAVANVLVLVAVFHVSGVAPRPAAPPAVSALAAQRAAPDPVSTGATPPVPAAAPPARAEALRPAPPRPAATTPGAAPATTAGKRQAASDRIVASRPRGADHEPRSHPALTEHAAPRTPTGARAGGADLKLDVLVYADDASQRSAWINGQRYVEGQRVTSRLVIDRITRDTVVLTGEGQRVLLRQQ